MHWRAALVAAALGLAVGHEGSAGHAAWYGKPESSWWQILASREGKSWPQSPTAKNFRALMAAAGEMRGTLTPYPRL